MIDEIDRFQDESHAVRFLHSTYGFFQYPPHASRFLGYIIPQQPWDKDSLHPRVVCRRRWKQET